MRIVLEHDNCHWLRVAGRAWLRHALVAWAMAAGALALVGGLALMESRGVHGYRATDRSWDGDLALRREISVMDRRRAALERAEQMLILTPSPVARLEVARCAWALARMLPPQSTSEHRALLLRADELLSDPAVIDILTPDDRCMKAHIVIALAPVLDLTNPRRNPGGMLAEGDGRADAGRAPRSASARRRRRATRRRRVCPRSPRVDT